VQAVAPAAPSHTGESMDKMPADRSLPRSIALPSIPLSSPAFRCHPAATTWPYLGTHDTTVRNFTYLSHPLPPILGNLACPPPLHTPDLEEGLQLTCGGGEGSGRARRAECVRRPRLPCTTKHNHTCSTQGCCDCNMLWCLCTQNIEGYSERERERERAVEGW
jgi:hypothetical protein